MTMNATPFKALERHEDGPALLDICSRGGWNATERISELCAITGHSFS